MEDYGSGFRNEMGIKMGKLDYRSLDENKYCALYSTILYFMQDNELPLMFLDKAYEDMQEGFRKDGLIKRHSCVERTRSEGGNKTMKIDASNVDTLDLVAEVKNRFILGDVITRCMVDNQMTLQDLDNACEGVREFYREQALLNKH